MAESVRGVTALENELAKAKESLKDVDENIKKLTGRDPGDNRPGQRRVSTGGPGAPNVGGRERLFALARRGMIEDGGIPPAKRRAVGGAFSRLGPRVGGSRSRPGPDSGDEEELPNRPTIQSSVIVTPKEARKREDIVNAQNKDERGKARNRRMFGLLLGTLQRFQDDAKAKVDKEERRKAIEEKLEEKAKMEKEDLKKERQSLFNQRRQKQQKLKRLEQKMELVQIHKEWEAETKRLTNFIRTKSTPHIFFLPRTPSDASAKKLKETRKVLDEIIRERRKQLEEEIEELTKEDEVKNNNNKHRDIEYEQLPELEEEDVPMLDVERKSSERDIEMKTIDNKENRTKDSRRRSSEERREERRESKSRDDHSDSDSDVEHDQKGKSVKDRERSKDPEKEKKKRHSSEGAQSDKSSTRKDEEGTDNMKVKNEDSSSEDESNVKREGDSEERSEEKVTGMEESEESPAVDNRRVVVSKEEPMNE